MAAQQFDEHPLRPVLPQAGADAQPLAELRRVERSQLPALAATCGGMQ